MQQRLRLKPVTTTAMVVVSYVALLQLRWVAKGREITAAASFIPLWPSVPLLGGRYACVHIVSDHIAKASHPRGACRDLCRRGPAVDHVAARPIAASSISAQFGVLEP